MRFLSRVALCAALFVATALPAFAAYPSTLPAASDFTISDTLTTTCSSSTPTGCAAHSVLGSVLLNDGSAIVSIGGTFTGSVTAEGGDCNAHWTPLLLLPPGSSSAAATSTTVAGIWRVHVQGFKCFQVRATTLTSGSIVASIHFSGAAASDPLDASGNVKSSVQNTVTVQPNGGSMNVAGQGSAGSPSGGVLTTQFCSGCTPFQTTISGTATTIPAGWTYYAVPASTACVSPNTCVIKSSPGVLAGWINESTTAQPTGNCILYDNASAASGQYLFIESAMNAGQILTFTQAGIKTFNGILLQCASTPTGAGFLILYN